MAAVKGAHSLHKNLFGDDEPVLQLTPSSDYYDRKVDCLIDYWFFLGNKKIEVCGNLVRMDYESQMKIASDAFFLSPHTIHDILKKNHDRLQLVKQQWRGTDEKKMQKHFAEKWPQYVW